MGGKSGTVAAERPVDFISNTGVGLDATSSKTMEDTTAKDKTIEKKKLGTRGLQIPLVADTSNTEINNTASGTGVQI